MEEEEPGEENVFRESIAGVTDVFRSGAENASAYLRARVELLRIEAEEAAAAAKRMGVMLGVAAGLLLVGYVFALLVAIFFFSGELGPNAQIALAVCGLVHLVAGVIFLIKARNEARRMRWFRESLEQLKQDQQWLESTLKRSDPARRS